MPLKKTYPVFLYGLIILVFNCTPSHPDYNQLPPFTPEGTVNAVIEIPAGTNDKIEFNVSTSGFEQDQIKGAPRVIQFLPYPGNYGFIPGTQMSNREGGDGDALDVLVIGSSLPTGTVVEVKPIAILRLLDNGKADHKIIALPINPEAQVIKTDNFMDFMIQYDAAKKIIEDWFLNYKGLGMVVLVGWENDEYALNEIKSRAVK